jgi:Nif-specific regulatory protein
MRSSLAMVASPLSDHEQLREERDLYLGLLGLSDRDHPEPFLEEALRLMVRILGAQQGYLEVFDPEGGPTWWRAAGCSDDQVEVIRTIVSRGIIAEALALGDVVACPSALLDPRFKDRPSVQASQIEAVLCMPIRLRTPIGVLYVQGRRAGGSFSDTEIERARVFARHLAPLVSGLLARTRHAKEDHVAPLRKRLKLDDVVGESAALAKVLREVEMIAPLDISVLVTGETGTGKTQLARIIHENGPRRGRPFMEVNCAAIPEGIAESELFGAMPGAYTGANRRMEGRIAGAEGGTLFLDEVGELSLPMQSKLLQFLQTKTYFPLGSNSEQTADVRVIAATNNDLEEAMRERRFRSDLFFRLQVLSIRMPSLSERRYDVVPLAQYFCERAARSHRVAHLELSPGALSAIETAEWQGNVRELAHAVEAATIRAVAEGARSVETTHVFREPSPSGGSGQSPLTFQEETRRFQSSLLSRALASHDWNITAAARSLDLTRAHVYNLIKAFGLTRNGSSGT